MSENELRVLNASKNKFFLDHSTRFKKSIPLCHGLFILAEQGFSTGSQRTNAANLPLTSHQSTNNIFRLLQNLLEWSRSQTGRLVVTPLEVRLTRIVDNSMSVLRPIAEQKNIRIEFDYDNNLTLFADPLMIETILRNLITNAIKFTPENGLIAIGASQSEDRINICVKDSGVGISEEDIVNLFKIDSTVKRKGTNNEDGSGLGLILCKEFVEKNNGKIWVASSPGNGSSFFFTVPAKTKE